MIGYAGKSLRVDLSEHKIEVIETPAVLCNKFIGGRGLGVAIIGKRIRHPYDSPEMPLIFASGPLVGTAAPTSGRSSVISRSPLTGTVFDCSVGGRFGTELKKAGFDFIEITGISNGWISLNVSDGSASIQDARSLQDKNVSEARSILGKEGSSAVIGIAGERGVRFASIVFDGHYLAGRGGLGTVMGVKKLKAINVKGTGKVGVYDETALKDSRTEIMRLLRASPAVFGELGLSEFGTAALVDLIHARRMEPTDNFKSTFYPSASSYSGYHLKNRYNAKKTGCAGCPILCKKIGEKGLVIPEYETVSHCGALNLNHNIEMIVEANRIFNDYGMDSITAAATIACFSEITKQRPDSDEFLKIVHQMGRKEKGLGELLAEGSFSYAQKTGSPGASMAVKGLELPAYDPRGAYGMALAYVTSNRGGCHLRAYPVSHEILRKPVATDRFSFEGKARIIKIEEDMNAVIDSLTACKFVFFAATLEEYSHAVSAVTGNSYSSQSLLKSGECIYLYERYLNSLNGFTSRDDELPERFFSEEGSSTDSLSVPPIDRQEFLMARSNYYKIRRCTEEGIPEKSYLQSIGLGDYL